MLGLPDVFTHSICGVRRLFEGQGRREGHFSMRFGSQEGTLAHVLAPKRAVWHAFLAPRRAL